MSKRKTLNFKSVNDASKFIRRIKNAFSEEGRDAADAIIEFIESLADREEEVSPEEIYGLVQEFIEAKVDERVSEEVANAVSKKFAQIQNSTNKTLPVKVQNAIAHAVLTSEKTQIENAVSKVLVENGITGLTFNEVIDFAIVDKWGASNWFFDQLKKVPFTKFFYTEQEITSASVIAKGWRKSNEYDKKVQDLVARGKTIATDYVYKRIDIAMSDLDDINASNGGATFLRWLNEELDRQIANGIAKAILVGDDTNVANDKVYTFETIGSKQASDFFTEVLNPENGDPTLGDLRRMRSAIHNPYGYPVTLCISRSLLDEVAKFVYAQGGSEDYRTFDELKAKIGVEEIFVTELIPAEGAVQAVMLIPEEYWVKEKNAISVAFPVWDKNKQMYQKERNIGGGIHGAKSTAVLRTA